eukprot:CAMPEP_0177537672 /NCGR_PEP_ID=MMETSP0369-20130122/57910_1 /TAXON_ID=447022 ORGANISM="Scrippsiella hangoei-like, Strain SHHI-4" /NCGR_SAMPLE_ID=MMETSP0369 /ASSEMBLY_ACC=CAM_ASM_000364 /LENGTH=41 /DNA_ID= /DNA_START= /DNA_END= /DNA_ORIENTATION=
MTVVKKEASIYDRRHEVLLLNIMAGKLQQSALQPTNNVSIA